MYVPQAFSNDNREQLVRLMREHSFATLVSASRAGPVVNHLPVLLDDTASVLYAHVARPNPVWRDFRPDQEILFIFHGPHHYVSPGWYASHPSVPTWNYAVVHARGHPAIVDERREVEWMLRELVQEQESHLAEQYVADQYVGQTWKMELPEDYLKKMLDGIVAFKMEITSLEAKFKLSQNRPDADRQNVIATLRQYERDSDAGKLAQLMKEVLGK